MIAISAKKAQIRKTLYTLMVLLAALVFSVAFAWVNMIFYNWLSPKFEASGTPTSWGIIQRLYLIVPGIIVSLWMPRKIGFQVGTIQKHWKLLAIMLVANVGIIGVYQAFSGETPYSGSTMLFNEVVTVPFVEEVLWRGIVFAAAFVWLSKWWSEPTSGMLAAVFSGVCFGLLHATNVFFGYPLAFVGLQTLNATVWGVVYGLARAKTGSLYPSIVLHAAMNLVVVMG